MEGTPRIIAASPRIRRARASDLPFLAEMGRDAAYWRPDKAKPSPEAALADQHLGRYLAGWGRNGDAGIVALDAADRPIGAAWYRLFSRDQPGYGFVAEWIPELSIAVRPEHRGAGVGTRLLRRLVELAREQGYAALSLSVERDNPAVSLYERLGFVSVGTDDGGATMRLDLL
jgi:ribosomal protein S18 acetylase RimI-like enzyme